MNYFLTRSCVFLVVGLWAVLAVAADDGWWGIGLKIEADGPFWNPTVQSASISIIAPNSPAAKERLAIGDGVIEVDGVPVAGSKGGDLKAKLRKKVGETVHLKLRRNDGTIYSAILTASHIPE